MPSGEIKSVGLHVPGFQHLGWLLPQHVDLVPELYFLFIALMMGQPVKLLPADSKVKIVICYFNNQRVNKIRPNLFTLSFFSILFIAGSRQRMEFHVRRTC